jgi:hypothetical protein
MTNADAGRRQADYFREVLHQELVETQQRVDYLTACLAAVIARDEAPITVKRAGRALKSATAKVRQVTDMLDALERSYPVAAKAVAS